MSKTRQQVRQGPFVAGFSLGIVVGGAIAGLSVPWSGTQLRQAVRNQSFALKEQAQNVVLQTKTTVREVMKRD